MPPRFDQIPQTRPGTERIDPGFVDRAARVMADYNKALQTGRAYEPKDTLRPQDVMAFMSQSPSLARAIEARSHTLATNNEANKRESGPSDEELLQRYEKYFEAYEMIRSGGTLADGRLMELPNMNPFVELMTSLNDRTRQNTLAAWVEYAFKKTAPLRAERERAAETARRQKEAQTSQNQAQRDQNWDRLRRLEARVRAANAGSAWESSLDESTWPRRRYPHEKP